MERSAQTPKHIAIIMDGNGRWADARGLPRMLGHRAGATAVKGIVEAGVEIGLEVLTLYAFSWENWSRPADEVRELMGLLAEFVQGELPALLKNRVRLRAIGRLETLPPEPLASLKRAMAETAGMDGMTLVLALSYGGRQELVDAARTLAAEVQRGALRVEDIDEAAVSARLTTAGFPDPDLLIRTSGEQRLSNFLLWQSSYTELYLTPKLWPDFTREDLLEAVAEFERRDRRYGGRRPEPESAPAAPGLAKSASREAPHGA